MRMRKLVAVATVAAGLLAAEQAPKVVSPTAEEKVAQLEEKLKELESELASLAGFANYVAQKHNELAGEVGRMLNPRPQRLEGRAEDKI